MVPPANSSFRLPVQRSVVQQDRKLRKDLRLLGLFIEMYCRANHQNRESAKAEVAADGFDGLTRQPLVLCPECSRLLKHAWVKRATCPLEPKPACKHCPSHCYHPTYRAQIREVMRDSGKRIVRRGRLDYLIKLLF